MKNPVFLSLSLSFIISPMFNGPEYHIELVKAVMTGTNASLITDYF